jgi:hypothetical protein
MFRDRRVVQTKYGTRMWYRDGELHRRFRPAIVYRDGSREWWHNGQWHRRLGPAVKDSDGTRMWWRHGEPVAIARPGEGRRLLREDEIFSGDPSDAVPAKSARRGARTT